jgi:hypothetical protein
MIVVVALVLAALFGGGDQYLGSMSWHPWAADVSLHSAAAFVHSESPAIVGGLFTAPLFGWFGQRWRTDRAWAGALATAALVCLEPLVRIPAGHAIRFRAVSLAEVAAGVAMVVYVVAAARAARRVGAISS